VLNAQNDAGSDHGHEYGTAYSIPALHRKQLAEGSKADVNFSVSLDQIVTAGGEEKTELSNYLIGDLGVDIGIEQEQELDIVRYLAKCADIRSLARLYLDIDEVFSQREYSLMMKTMREQNTLNIATVAATTTKERRCRYV
jgi:hypothetical protein